MGFVFLFIWHAEPGRSINLFLKTYGENYSSILRQAPRLPKASQDAAGCTSCDVTTTTKLVFHQILLILINKYSISNQ